MSEKIALFFKSREDVELTPEANEQLRTWLSLQMTDASGEKKEIDLWPALKQQILEQGIQAEVASLARKTSRLSFSGRLREAFDSLIWDLRLMIRPRMFAGIFSLIVLAFYAGAIWGGGTSLTPSSPSGLSIASSDETAVTHLAYIQTENIPSKPSPSAELSPEMAFDVSSIPSPLNNTFFSELVNVGYVGAEHSGAGSAQLANHESFFARNYSDALVKLYVPRDATSVGLAASAKAGSSRALDDALPSRLGFSREEMLAEEAINLSASQLIAHDISESVRK